MERPSIPPDRTIILLEDGTEIKFEELSDSFANLNDTHWLVANSNDRLTTARQVFNAIYFGAPTLFVQGEISTVTLEEILESLEKHFHTASYLMAFLTSGSTGTPKVVVHHAKSLLDSARKIGERYPEIKGKIWHHLMPNNYMAGVLNCTIVPWLNEGSVYLDNAFNFTTPLTVSEKSTKYKTQVAWMSPSMITAVSHSRSSRSPSSLNWLKIFSATGPLDTAVRDNAQASLGIDVLNTYGTTEQLFIASELAATPSVTCGAAYPGVDVFEIGSGQLEVTSDTTALGLFIQDEHHKYIFHPIEREEPQEISDFGSIQGGLISVTGRADSIVVLGGVNVSLSQVESTAMRYPGVVDCFATAPNGGTVRDLELFIEISSTGSGFDQRDFRTKLYEQLGNDSSPRKITITKLPRTPNGKVDRQKLMLLARGVGQS